MAATNSEGLSSRLFRYAGLRSAFFELLVSGLLINMLALALPLVLLQMYDRIIPNKSLSTLSILIVGVLSAIFLETLLRILRSHVTGWLGARFEHRVSVAGLEHLTRVPTRHFTAEETGVYTEQLRAAGQVRDFYSGQALLVLLDLPFAVLYVTVIGLIGGWLAAVAVGMIGLFLLVTSYYGSSLRNGIKARTMQDDRRYNFLIETFRGVHSVKTMAMEPLMHRRYECLQEANVDQGANVAGSTSTAGNLGQLFSQFMTVAIVATGAYFAVDNDMTPGALAACIMLANRALQPLRRSLATWIRFQSFKVARDRLADLFKLPTSTPPPPVANFGEIDGAIELRDVKVQFPRTQEPLFENLNLTVTPGECVAILGDSGSGKSSLMNLIGGVLDQDEGEILIDGVPIDRIPASELDQSIAHLPQRGTLIDGTILENVTMFDDDLTEQAIRACEAVALDEVVAGLRLGYETPVGDGAVDMMPAGIRQRISIAREIIHNPKIILFDEANIAMDGRGDAALRDYLVSMKGKATIFLVAHRPSLIKMADSFYSLEDGKLIPTSLEEHLASGRLDADETKAVLSPEPEHMEWQLSDSVGHFPVTSDLSLCLPALLAGLKWRGASRTVAESLPHLAESLDLSGLRSIMATLGYESDSYQTKFNKLDPRLLPCLFVPEDSPAKVVLDWTPEHGYRVFDSETVSVHTGVDLKQTGEAYVFRQTNKEDVQTVQRGGRWTRDVIFRFKGFMALTLGITILATILSLATPLFVMATFNFVLPTKDMQIAMLLVLGVSIAFLIEWQLKRLKGRILSFMAGRSEFIIGNSIFQKILNLPPPAIERVPVAEQVARVKDLESLREFFLGPLSTLAYELPATMIFVVVLIIINPWMLVVVLFVAAAYAILGGLTFGPQTRRTTKASRLKARRDEFLEETLDNMSTLKSADATDRWIERYREFSGAASIAEFKATQFNERISAISQAISMVGGVSALTVAGIGAMNGTVSGGAIIASMIIMWRLTAPIQNAFMSASTIVRVFNSLRQIDNLMKLDAEQEIESRQATRHAMRGGLEFSRVSFRYTMNADPALLGLSFDVEPGEVVAIAGPNGSGKSTLLKLLVRAYHPQAGSIRLDGTDIRQMSPARLREEVSYMPQHCEIYYGTIAQNLRLVHPTASDEDLRWAAEQADVLDEIMALEQGSGNWKRTGFDYRLSDSQADQMPNGFRQKIGLARAFLKPASLVLFDEPGNGLDPEGDQAFVNALDFLRQRSTVFIVSHRPSHLKLADKVIYLEQGAIRTMGNFENDNVKQVVMANLG